jgi:L-asparagine transporter-like permease
MVLEIMIFYTGSVLMIMYLISLSTQWEDVEVNY